jgi:hypothetical protein
VPTFSGTPRPLGPSRPTGPSRPMGQLLGRGVGWRPDRREGESKYKCPFWPFLSYKAKGMRKHCINWHFLKFLPDLAKRDTYSTTPGGHPGCCGRGVYRSRSEVEPYRGFARCIFVIFQKYAICSILATPL